MDKQLPRNCRVRITAKLNGGRHGIALHTIQTSAPTSIKEPKLFGHPAAISIGKCNHVNVRRQ